MLKHKIISIIMGTLVLSGIMIGASSINNTKVVNKVLLASPSSLVGERAVVVNTDNSPLVLYSNASGNSNITSYISVGEMLTIQSSGDNFYKVKVQETGAVGYISAHNLQIITSGVNDPYSAVNKDGYIINVSSRVNLRANATMSSNILTKLSNNTKINVLGKQGQWYKVNCNGTIGYIYQEYVGLTNTNLDINNTSKLTNTSDTSKVSSNIKNKQNSGTIKYSVPQAYSLNTVVVTNTTGKSISSSELSQFLRSWILKGQYNNDYIPTDRGTQWASPWLNKVSNKTIIQAFIEANGEAALSKNITANEFIKATQKLNDITINNIPFTLSEAKTLIINMLEQDNYAKPSDITKIVLVTGSPNVYKVYTKESGNNVFWIVAANTGNARG
ncbi:SH3 domain-containing protein [Clostridium mediterraneense]|uniref:SH3 domain-containing protein n=1 Tax=Clostridium mediterraneense TaxID=1805472 RepID=UPI000836C81D|nr:SH3 domain-containing protein [Clostridium mediterraneense]